MQFPAGTIVMIRVWRESFSGHASQINTYPALTGEWHLNDATASPASVFFDAGLPGNLRLSLRTGNRRGEGKRNASIPA